MYTRCPACSTCFRATERHLAIANGKVRCGRCQLVFNALEHSIDDLPLHKITPAAPSPAAKNNLETSIKPEETTAPKQKNKVPPAPVAPTAKEKQEAMAAASTSFDANSTMIADTSMLDNNEVEEINLDISSNHQDDESEDDNHLFDNHVDFDTVIDELDNTTTELEPQNSVSLADEEKVVPAEENDSNDIFQTDAYDATSASSVADILNEMEGQLSLDIPDPENDKTNKQNNINDNFDFLELNKDSNEQLTEQEESEPLKHHTDDVFEVDNTNETKEVSNEFIDLNAETIQKEDINISSSNNEVKNEENINDDESIYDDEIENSDVKEESFIEEFAIENPKAQQNDEPDIPIQLRDDVKQLQSSSRRGWHPVLTLLSVVILLALSFSQLALFRSHDLVNHIPASRPLLEAFCKTIGCHYSGPHDIKKIQLLSRDVRLHPKEKKALLISAAMINNAHFAQPYPNIHIRLSDISGNVVAERIFDSKTYMGKLSTPFLLMKPQTPVHINFEVVDPGKDAINFEFNFL